MTQMPDEIFIQWRDKTHEAEHELRGNHFRVSDGDEKYHHDRVVTDLKAKNALILSDANEALAENKE